MSDYDMDIVLWSERQGTLLRRLAAGEPMNELPDWQNIAEEIESVGRSERSSLASHIRVVLEHLPRLACSPAVEPRGGWRQKVLRARAAIEEILEASPGLRPSLDVVITREMDRVRPMIADALAHYGEAPCVPLDQLTFDRQQILGPWLPDAPAS